MAKNLRWKFLLIVGVVALMVYSFYPLDKKVRLGLDLKGGDDFLGGDRPRMRRRRWRGVAHGSILSPVPARVAAPCRHQR